MARTFDEWRGALRRGDWDAYQTLDRRFHVPPFEACGSPWLAEATTSLWDACVRYQEVANHQPGGRRRLTPERREILAPSRQGIRTEAAAAISRPIERTVETIEGLGADVLQ